MHQAVPMPLLGSSPAARLSMCLYFTHRNCTYPQHLTLELERPGRLHQIQLLSHEYKIASKVEIQVAGSRPTPAAPYSFTRLGYMSFDPNERTKFAARELKSVSLPDVEAAAVRIVFHRCSQNTLNAHGQVGIIMVNFVGTLMPEVPQVKATAAPAVAETAPAVHASPPQRSAATATRVSASQREPEVDAITAGHIEELQALKAAAVEAEDYDAAKRLKASVDRLRSIGAKIAALEARKAAAVAAEDYDSAKALKTEVERMRMRAYGPILRGEPSEDHLHTTAPASTVAAVSGPSPQHSSASPGGAPTPGSGGPTAAQHSPLRASSAAAGDDLNRRGGDSPSCSISGDWDSYDERPARARGAYNLENVDENTPPPGAPAPRTSFIAPGGGLSGAAAASGPAPQQAAAVDDAGPPPRGFPADLPPPEPLSIEDAKEAAFLTGLVGEYLARCVYSRTWQLREAALSTIAAQVASTCQDELHGVDGSGDALRMLCVLVTSGLKDRIPAVGAAALSLLRAVATTKARRFPSRDLHAVLTDLVPVVAEKAADVAPRSREQAIETLVALASCKEAGMRSMAHLLLRPFKKGELPRATLGRLLLVTSVLPAIGLASGAGGEGFAADAVMRFATPALTSASAEVRAAASELTLKLGALAGPEAVMALLPADLNPKLREQIECGLTGKQPAPASAPVRRATSGHAGGATKRSETAGKAPGQRASSSHAASNGPRQPSARPRTSVHDAPAAPPPGSRRPSEQRQRASEPHGLAPGPGAPKAPGRTSQPHFEKIPAGPPETASPPVPHPIPAHRPRDDRHHALHAAQHAHHPQHSHQPGPPSPGSPPGAAMAELSVADEDPAPFEAELRAREAALGPGHPAVAEAASNLAIIYNQRGEPHLALPLYQRALAVWQAAHGPDHPDVAHALTDIAVIHLEAGRDAEGKALLRKALAVQERVLGPNHPDVIAIRDVLEE